MRTYVDRRPGAVGERRGRARLGHAEALSLCPAAAGGRWPGLADRRRRGPSQRHRQRHGGSLRQARELDPRAFPAVREGRAPLVGPGDGAGRLPALLRPRRVGRASTSTAATAARASPTASPVRSTSSPSIATTRRASPSCSIRRRKPKAGLTLGEYVKGQGPVVANLGEYLGAGEVAGIDEHPARRRRDRPARAGQARGLSWRGRSRSSSAARPAPMSAASSIGTASKNAGIVRATVRSSCPTARVINGPAISPLAKVDQPASQDKEPAALAGSET